MEKAMIVLLSTYAVILLAILTAGGIDFGLWVRGEETISQFLRANPRWFWLPIAVTVLFWIGLGIHLFGRGE
jgi:uncharacterized membrane protein YbhN (UPF0104 family)